ncbi:thioredoxin [Leptospira kobayashii]|uniref:Thioredoxin n=1 Tax=Leptospira kobayashii TaxID=1917830 RepID=A0ABN6KB69_9LEPT|nr:redoxin domain-containing protein [Leptospira kobayashii]BDA78182.1 thioredoxin [Leptospira kobayashii]
MIFWKNWPYRLKVVSAFFIFFVATLVFGFFKGRGFDPRIPIETLAETPGEAISWEKKPKVIYFWATWCTVCKGYSYILNSNLNLLNQDKTTFLSVVAPDEEGSPDTLQKYIKDHDIKYPVLKGNYQLLRDWGISAFPTTVFLNAKGEVVFADTGIISPMSFWLRSFLTTLF